MTPISGRFVNDLGIEVPLICGPMFPGSNPELIAAVSEAGGIGVIQPVTMTFMYKHDLRDGVRKIRELTSKTSSSRTSSRGPIPRSSARPTSRG